MKPIHDDSTGETSRFAHPGALDSVRRAERAAADLAAARFLAVRNERVAQASLRDGQGGAFAPSRFRLIVAAAAGVFAILGGGAFLMQSMQSPVEKTGFVTKAAGESSTVPSIEDRIMAAKAGSVIELESGTFETALTVRKAVRLVAIDGVVQIGVNALKNNKEGNMTQSAS